MAHVKSIDIYFDSAHRDPDIIKVLVSMKPAGQCNIEVPVPHDFYDCILKLAQTAADQHEQQMRAQILADGQAQKP